MAENPLTSAICARKTFNGGACKTLMEAERRQT
jgi:hypothetical protein